MSEDGRASAREHAGYYLMMIWAGCNSAALLRVLHRFNWRLFERIVSYSLITFRKEFHVDDHSEHNSSAGGHLRQSHQGDCRRPSRTAQQDT